MLQGRLRFQDHVQQTLHLRLRGWLEMVAGPCSTSQNNRGQGRQNWDDHFDHHRDQVELNRLYVVPKSETTSPEKKPGNLLNLFPIR
jgi:hypothetical protein